MNGFAYLRAMILGLMVMTGSAALAAEPAAAPANAQMSMNQTTPDLFSTKASAPDISTIPVLANMAQAGAKLHYLGERSNMSGWLILKDGQIQMIYLTPDKQTAFVGGMFTSMGENVTGPQISKLAENNKEVNDLINGVAIAQNDVTRAGVADGGVASVPAGPSIPTGTALVNKLPAVTMSPGERLLQDLKAASGVTLGSNDKAELIMVVSPDCAHCKKTWLEMRDAVAANKLQVRMIPINRELEGDETRVAAKLLRAEKPFEAWDKYVNGDKTALAGDADQAALRAIGANRVITDRWNILGTPYLVYRAKDTKVKIVQGRPERMPAVLADLSR